MDGYNKKKYVCKLLFMFLLGHDIDFGHIEAVNLTTSNKYTEKYIVSLNQYATSRRDRFDVKRFDVTNSTFGRFGVETIRRGKV